MIVIGASNIGYNYDFNKLSIEFPKYSIYTISYSEPAGLFLLYDNLNRFKLTENDILIWDLPHSFFEPDKYLPISEKSFILKYKLI